MASSKRGIMVFLISLFASLIVLGGIFYAFFMYSKTTNANNKQEGVQYVNKYIPKTEENLNVLLIGCEELSLPPTMFLLLRYDAINSMVYLTAIPPDTLSTVGVREDTILGHYDYEGTRGGVNAVKNLFLTDIDRYMRLDKKGIANMVDSFGGIEYDVKSTMTISGETIPSGKQLLDGRRVASIILEADNISMQSELSALLVNQRFKKNLENKYPHLVSAFFYNAETNLNQYDFAFRQKGITQALSNETFSATEILLEGEQSYEGFTPTDKSLQNAMNILNKSYDE